MTVDVSTPDKEYLSRVGDLAMVNALLGGTAAMRSAGSKYLPKFETESADNYNKRLNQAVLFDAFSQTISDLVGLPFSKKIIIGDKVPTRIVDILKNIDGKHGSIDSFARKVFEEGLAKGASHILVEMKTLELPEGQDSATAADDKKRQPYWVLIYPEQLISARTEIVKGSEKFTHVRIREKITQYDQYEEKTIDRIREITPEGWCFHTKDDKGWVKGEMKSYDLDYVALVPFLSGRNQGTFTSEPPLINLAYQNIAHWQSSSDQQRIVSWMRFAILAIIGIEQKEDDEGNPIPLEIGPDTTMVLPIDGDAKYVEHSGSAIGEGWKDLEMRKAEMAIAGSSLLVKKPRMVTATENTIETIKEQTALQVMVRSFEASMNIALKYTADWLSLPDAGTVSVNKEFSIAINADKTRAIVLELLKNGSLALKTSLSQLKKAGYFDEEFDVEQALKEILEEDIEKLLDDGKSTEI